MNVEQMKGVLREILVKTDLTPCAVGHRGVGKTAGIVQVCHEIGRRYIPLRLGQMEVGDLVGIPWRDGEVMRWSRPSWWPTENMPPAVIHCDELNRAQQEDTLQAIFQFVEPPVEGLPRALHTHQLDARHRVVVSINPPDGTYQVATLDRALLDRMVMLYVETDPACWGRYAATRDLDRDVRHFIGAHPHFLAHPGPPLDMGMEPTERAWEMVSTLRGCCTFPQDLEMEVYSGIVGQEAAVTFLRWCADQEGRPLTAAEILDDWEGVAARAAIQREDRQAASIHDLVTRLSQGSSLTLVQQDHLVAYLAILPRDLCFGTVKSLLRIPQIAEVLAEDRYDSVVHDALAAIGREA